MLYGTAPKPALGSGSVEDRYREHEGETVSTFEGHTIIRPKLLYCDGDYRYNEEAHARFVMSDEGPGGV